MFNWFKKNKVTAPDVEPLESEIHNSQAVAQRLISIIAITSKVHNLNSEKILEWVKNNNIEKYFSDSEKEFFYNENPNQDKLVHFSWQAEAAVSLLWALNILKEMPNLNQQFDIYKLEEIGKIVDSPTQFISSAVLRNKNEIKEKENDLVHQHWRLRDAELFNASRFIEKDPEELPLEELDYNIVYQRRYGLSWLVWTNEEWDTVSTDT